MDINEVILQRLEQMATETRNYQSTNQKWQQETGERLATVETKVDSVVGATKPGLLDGMEKRLKSVEQWRWKAAGALGLGSALVGVASIIIEHYWK